MQSLRLVALQCHLPKCRGLSTSTLAQKEPRSFTLPPARLRALIALYHRSSSFITPANLSSRIDQAFTVTLYKGDILSQHASYQALASYSQRKRVNEPQPPYYKDVRLYFDSTTWSDKRGVRQARVRATLWGTQVGGKPDLETVLETSATNDREGGLLDQTVSAGGF